MNKRPVFFALGAYLIAGANAAYMIFLRAPAVVEVRPELASVDFGTALFSGRFNPWLYYHYPVAGTLLALAIVTIVVSVAVVIIR